MKLDAILAIFSLGGTELILILAVALLLFGGKKLPELAKGLGQGIREFKKATGNASESIRHATEDTVSRRLLPVPDSIEHSASLSLTDASVNIKS